ncbi:BON domain-containing protein [Tautonia plasticadhaerens]|uniref:BON domain protein n=1 Tax=Tautonia plasticadhaerens TaxID=2527974 RepID=A0A518HCC0_9BACT|nr:BON domain-containing protein [Tautonia plasticadhaerens]QDV38487.1 BON domain protein [Tautonia plasticadhaerens]
MRTRTRFGAVTCLTVTLAGMLVPASTGNAQLLRPDGPAEQVGEVVGGALDTAGRAVERGLRTAFARTRGAVESMEVIARVYSRLHWDKQLAGSRLYLESRPGGVVLLRGSVPSAEAADRAVALAASTLGVSQVVSELVAPDRAEVVVPGSASPADPTVRPPLPEVEPEPELDPLPRVTPDPRPAPAPDPITDPVPSPTVRPPMP